MKKKTLHILMLTEYFLPFDRGGSEWSVYYLSKGLIGRGHTVTIFTPNYGAKKQEDIEGIKIYRFPFWKKLTKSTENITPFYHSNIFWVFTTTLFLIKFCLKKRPQVLHIQGKYFLPAAVVVGKIFSIPTVVTIRDYMILCPYAFCIRPERKFRACKFLETVFLDREKFLRTYQQQPNNLRELISFFTAFRGWWVAWWLRRFLKATTLTVAVSKKLAQIYENNDIRTDQVVYNSFHFTKLVAAKRENYIVFAGRLTPGKGITELVEAFRKQQRYPWKLIVIGEGFLRRHLEITTPAGNVNFLGQLPYSDVRKYLGKAQLVVVPSVWEEPFGRVALEALASGTPVLVTNCGGLPEIVTDGKTGIIVEPTIAGLQYGLSQAHRHITYLQETVKKRQKSLVQKYEIDPLDQYENIYYGFKQI